MAMINLTKEELAHQLEVGGIINKDTIGSAYGTYKFMKIVVNVDMTCSQLESAFLAFGYLGIEVLGIDHNKNQFLWKDDCEYGCSSFILSIKDGVLRAEMGSVPVQEWLTD